MDEKSIVGIGFQNQKDVATSIQKAIELKEKFSKITFIKGTICNNLEDSKYKGAIVLMVMSASSGTGVKADLGAMRAVLKSGVKSVLANPKDLQTSNLVKVT